MSTTEYAKLLRWYAPSSGVTGLKTTITIPSNVSETSRTKIGGSKANGFINFYLAADGSNNHVECGISTNWVEQGNRWHWFWTHADVGSGGDPLWSFTPGQVVPIELSINSAKTAMDFIVNGTTVKSFAGTYSTLTNVRLVVGACDQNFVKRDANGNLVPDVPSTMPNWNTLHNQVVCSNFQYRNTSNTWVTCTKTNSTPPTPWDPATNLSSEEVHWPTPSDSYPHQGTPLAYILQVTSGQLIASLKQF